ncbi:MAG: hypothetical protein ACYCVN_13980 [Acidimicrobiales bacterium]
MWQWSPPRGSELYRYPPALNYHASFTRRLNYHASFTRRLNHHVDDRVSGLSTAYDHVRRSRIHDTATWLVDVHQ